MADKFPRLKVDVRILEEMQQIARARWPEECCGLLIGNIENDAQNSVPQGAYISSVLESPNCAPGDRRRSEFEIDPALHLATQRQLRETTTRIIGYFHSHPNGRPDLSEKDKSQALDAGYIWMVIALKSEQAQDVACNAFFQTNKAGPAEFLKMHIDSGRPS